MACINNKNKDLLSTILIILPEERTIHDNGIYIKRQVRIKTASSAYFGWRIDVATEVLS